MNNTKSFLPLPRTCADGTHSAHAPLKALVCEEIDADKPFPTESLPLVVREFVQALSAQERTKDSLAACCGLGVLSASLGAGVCVESGPNRVSFGNLFLAVIAESGTGKSQVFNATAAPLIAEDNHLSDMWVRMVRPRLEADRVAAEIARKAVAERIKKEGCTDKLRAEMAECQARCNAAQDALDRPERLLVNNVTMEKLAVLLQSRTECLASLSGEAREMVDNALGRYHQKGSPDADLYLKGWSRDPARVDRGCRPPVHLKAPTLAVLWLMQPDKLSAMFSKPELIERGFLPRFLICRSYSPLVKKSEGAGVAVPPEVQRKWESLVTRMLNAFRLHEPQASGPQRATITVPDGVRQKLDDFYDDIIEQRRNGRLADVAPFAARWAEQAWRIAVILHVVEHGESGDEEDRMDRMDEISMSFEDKSAADTGTVPPIPAYWQRVESSPLSAQTAENAIAVVRWFAEQLLALLDGSRTRQREEQAAKLNLLLDQKPEGVAPRDLVSRRVAATAAQASSLLDQYCEAGWLQPYEQTPERGGHPKRLYRRGGVLAGAPVSGPSAADAASAA